MRHVVPGLLVTLFAVTVAWGAETPISTTTPGPTASGVNAATIVALGDGFLSLWTEGPPCFQHVLRGTRLDRDGHVRDAPGFVVAPAAEIVLATASDGDAAYIALRTHDSSYRLHLIRVSPDAAVTELTDAIPFASTTRTMVSSHGYFLFLATAPGASQAPIATLVDSHGAVVRSGVPLTDPSAVARWSDVVAIGSSFLLGWIDTDGRVHATSISLADLIANQVPVTPVQQGSTGNAAYLRLASDGVHTMAFWSEANELRVRSLSSNGTPLTAGPVSVGSYRIFEAPTVVVVSDGYEVVFREGGNPLQIVSLRLGFDGTVRTASHSAPKSSLYEIEAAQNGDRMLAAWVEIHTSGLEPATTADNRGSEAYVADISDGSVGTSAVVSLSDPLQHVRKLLPFAGGVAALWTESVPNARLAVGRLSAAGTPVDGAGLRLRGSAVDQNHSAIATDGQRLFVVWTESDSATAKALYGAVVSAGTSLSANALLLSRDADYSSDPAVVWNGETFTVVYHRTYTAGGEFAALRVDRSGNVVDPFPVALTASQPSGENPRLAWSGSDYLLVWQRIYDPFVYLPEPIPCVPLTALPGELRAQRLSAALTAVGPQLELASTTNYDDYLLDVQDVDVAFAGNQWLVLWYDRRTQSVSYARIDQNGTRLDPLNGSIAFWSCEPPFLAVAGGGWTVASQNFCGQYGTGVTTAKIGPSGRPTLPVVAPLTSLAGVEAFTLTPLPLVAYKRAGSPAVFIDALPQHGRTVRR